MGAVYHCRLPVGPLAVDLLLRPQLWLKWEGEQLLGGNIPGVSLAIMANEDGNSQLVQYSNVYFPILFLDRIRGGTFSLLRFWDFVFPSY